MIFGCKGSTCTADQLNLRRLSTPDKLAECEKSGCRRGYFTHVLY